MLSLSKNISYLTTSHSGFIFLITSSHTSVFFLPTESLKAINCLLILEISASGVNPPAASIKSLIILPSFN